MSRTLEEIQLEVAQWSTSNFGAQESKAYPDMILGSLAPLMGMMEEVGEWFSSETTAEQRDALADVGVYLCDYASREGFILPEPELKPDPPGEDPLALLVMALGKLFHVTLKRHQGIRGFDNLDHYRKHRDAWVGQILNALVEYSETDFQTPFLEILDEVWTTVRNRNWKNNPGGPS